MQQIYQKAQAYAQRLIRYRSRSEKELKARLREKGYNEQIIEKISSSFKEKGLIGDEKFAHLWARMRSQTTPYATEFIKKELLSKKIDEDIVNKVIYKLKNNFNEEDTARELLNKRLNLVKNLDKQKARRRLYGYLKRRGFSTYIIMRLLNPLGAGDNDEAY